MKYSNKIHALVAQFTGEGPNVQTEQALIGVLLGCASEEIVVGSVVSASNDAGLAPEIFISELQQAQRLAWVRDLKISQGNFSFVLQG